MTDRAAGPTVLVVGYGSDLRGDDAAGRRVAEVVAARELPGATVRSLPQLGPELAVDLCECDLAIFVDASVVDREVRVRWLAPAAPDWRMAHDLRPESLLSLAAAMGSAPPAAIVTLPAEDTDLGTELSAVTAAAVPVAVEQVVGLCGARQRQPERGEVLRMTVSRS